MIITKKCYNPIGEKSFYDHIIRNKADYINSVHYIMNNDKIGKPMSIAKGIMAIK
jgi:hypothetical protein